MCHEVLLRNLTSYIANESNILERDKQAILNVVKPALSMHCKENKDVSNDSKLSKIGGVPIINKKIADFLEAEEDYAFVFQLDFKNFSSYSKVLNLPSSGIISLFLKLVTKDGFTYLNPADCKCFFIKDSSELFPAPPLKFTIEQSEIAFEEALSIPDDEDEFWEGMEDDYDDFGFDVYEQLQDKIYEICKLNEFSSSGEFSSSHVGGYDDAVQSCVLYDFSGQELIDKPMMSREYYEEYQSKWNEIKTLSSEYVLICQLDSNAASNRLDNYLDGILYLGIRKDELEANNFDNIRVVFQNT